MTKKTEKTSSADVKESKDKKESTTISAAKSEIRGKSSSDVAYDEKANYARKSEEPNDGPVLTGPVPGRARAKELAEKKAQLEARAKRKAGKIDENLTKAERKAEEEAIKARKFDHTCTIDLGTTSSGKNQIQEGAGNTGAKFSRMMSKKSAAQRRRLPHR